MLTAFERLGLHEDTIVVVTSDHGEGLMRHDMTRHGYNVREEAEQTIVVLLLFRWPTGISSAQVFTEPVELVNIMPTIIDLTECPTDGLSVQGQSLAGALMQRLSLHQDRTVFLHQWHYLGRLVENNQTFLPFRFFRQRNI